MSTCLIRFDEFGPGMGLPSMKESFCDKPYAGQDAILDYLNKGQKTYAAAGRAHDVFTGEIIPGEWCGMTDGEYTWQSMLSYYVKKYNLRLNKGFEDKVLGLKQ